MKILVVDDVGYTRHFHVRLLQKFGHDVLSAETGPQALKMLERDMGIDVVLTDLMMRDMDGVELFKAALRISRVVDGGNAPSPVFILMTALRPGGNSQQKDIEKLRMAKEIGFIDVLYKPIEPEQLRSVLENVKFARGKIAVDVAGASRRVTETVDHLVTGDDLEASTKFVDCLRTQLERLEDAIAEKTETV
ncbi:MAG TPA: response regulator [Planctomycetaceae bacterium]|nr:response regulator [Planctomycetaceae bacterium]